MRKPTLSIITINFNNREGLLRTLQSVQRQTFDAYEHIIIDAGSTDGSLEAITQYERENDKLTFRVSEPDRGVFDGMNKGIDRAAGDYLCFLNSGDTFAGDVLAEIPFDGTQYIYGDAIVTSGKKAKKCTFPDVPDLLFLAGDAFCHQSCFIHRSLFENKRYDTGYRILSDWIHSFQCIVMERCSYRHLPTVLAVCEGGGFSSDRKATRAERFRWFDENFPPVWSRALRDCAALETSTLRPEIRLVGDTRQFKHRIKKVIMFLYRIHTFFSH